MGLENKGNDSNITYLSVIMGSFRKKVQHDTPGAEKRKNANNDEVWELCHDTLTGRLVDINVSEPGEYGKQWNLVIQDMETHDVFIVNLMQNSSSASGFLNRLLNMDLSIDVELRAYYFAPDKDKPENMKGFMSVLQDGVKIDSSYTKDNPGDLPELEPIKVNGKDQWDGTKRNLFYEAMVEQYRTKNMFIGIQKGEGSGTQEEPTLEPVAKEMEDILPDTGPLVAADEEPSEPAHFGPNAAEKPIGPVEQLAIDNKSLKEVTLDVKKNPLTPEQIAQATVPETQVPGLSNQEPVKPEDDLTDDLPF